MALGLRCTFPVISTVSAESHLLPLSIQTVGWSASAWLAANTAIFVPITLPVPTRIRQLGWINGGTANNNVDVGIYNRNLVRLVSSGSTAQASTNAVQLVNITDLELVPGTYYLALACDGVTGIFGRITPGIALQRQHGVFEQASAFALPNPCVPAIPTNAYVPVILAIAGRFV